MDDTKSVIPVVDVHAHLFPEAWRNEGIMPDDMFDVDGLLERQQTHGISRTVVSDPHIWYGKLDIASIERCREYNEFASDVQRLYPNELAAFASVTPWAGHEHLAEAQHAIAELGLRGVGLATSHHQQYLDAVPEEFWEWASENEVPIFVHPGGAVVGDEQMGGWRLGETCGRPLDTTLTLARFIMAGIPERFPRLRMLCAHAGGAICALADRLDFGYELRDYEPLGKATDIRLSRPPTAFVSQLFLDTVTYGVSGLRLALERVGPSKLMYGSDRPPVPFSPKRMMGHVKALDLAPEDFQAVLGGNAAKLLGLP